MFAAAAAVTGVTIGAVVLSGGGDSVGTTTTSAPVATTAASVAPGPDFDQVLSVVTCETVYGRVAGLHSGGSSGTWSWGPVDIQPGIVWEVPVPTHCTYRNPPELALQIQAPGEAQRIYMMIGFSYAQFAGHDTVEAIRDEFLTLHQGWVEQCNDWAASDQRGDCFRELQVQTDTPFRFVAESRFYQERTDDTDIANTIAVVFEQIGPGVVVVEWRIGADCPPVYRDDTGDSVQNDRCQIGWSAPPSSVPWAISVADAIRDLVSDL